MEIDKYIEYLNNQPDVIAYKQTKDIGNNDYFIAVIENTTIRGDVVYYLYNIYNVFAGNYCRDLREFCFYKTKDLAIQAIGRICGSGNITIVKQ